MQQAAYTKELELVIALSEQTQLAPVIGWTKNLLAMQYICCGRMESAEDLLIDSYIQLS